MRYQLIRVLLCVVANTFVSFLCLHKVNGLPKKNMSKEEQNAAFFQIIRGFPFPAAEWFTQKNVEDAMDFVPEDDDIIITSYPKTGTTWMQYIILQILSKGQLFPSMTDATMKVVPFLEMTGTDAVKAQGKPRIYKHHIAYDMVQKNRKSKCIYTYRNPEDTVVSYYHFIKSLLPKFQPDFNTFFDNFVSGKCAYGSYFKHILSFYEHREDKNLLMVSYEKLHANRREEILKIAKFLGDEHHRSLLEDDQLLNKIIEHTSFGYMKKNLTVPHPNIMTGEQKESPEEQPEKIALFRKGIVGDGKSALSEEQRQHLKTAATEVLKGTCIINEWYSS